MLQTNGNFNKKLKFSKTNACQEKYVSDKQLCIRLHLYWIISNVWEKHMTFSSLSLYKRVCVEILLNFCDASLWNVENKGRYMCVILRVGKKDI